ncbi:hypothetical protein [Flocculibacter collagenilyticus]|uniref:hypothetical protein n=1 Tax=Flocculibacter collagenilyticus TaxID=2744479 RepID=UPI0018F5E2F5|nr:hypothetical protein [Flocculibacter collagenilyticus]
MSGCTLESQVDLSDYSKEQLSIIKEVLQTALIGKGAIIFGNILSLFSRSASKRFLAAKGSTDWSNISKSIEGLDKVARKKIIPIASSASLRTNGSESQF